MVNQIFFENQDEPHSESKMRLIIIKLSFFLKLFLTNGVLFFNSELLFH